jgi:putative transcriptional regulator
MLILYNGINERRDNMLKYKINIADALERKGFNTYKAKTTKILSQDTLKKIKEENTNISLESLNRICILLDMQPKDLIEYVEDKEEKNKYKIF